ncbi:MAG: protein-L-isoaspartate(D-aspartate) O-methyltransferase [Acidimicrobiia bacterium]|nr:protein-L-isoaspartate(D-aspartate) O-methyltransferase [Acidimicrobiia bacterium]
MYFPPDITDSNVLQAMNDVPRHRFVPARLIAEAEGDYPLPIGYGQTISQPYIVATMSQALEVGPGDTVLEIGTGSGYQAAVLAAMGCKVYSVEIIPELAEQAAAVLDELGYDVTIMIGDGYHGWEEHAPYQGIIVTAAPDIPPQALLDQLDLGASLVIPVGPAGGLQTLWRFTRLPTGDVARTRLAGVRFVPFTREGGRSR